MLRIWILIAAASLLAGCATDPLEAQKDRLVENRRAFAAGDYLLAYRNLVDSHDLGRQDGIGAANRALIAAHPQFLTAVELDLRQRADSLATAAETIAFAEEVARARFRGLVAPEVASELQALAGRTAIAGLESGRMRFTLADGYEAVEGLRAFVDSLLLDNSIAVLSADTDPPPALIARVMAAVKSAGPGSAAARKVAAALPAMQLSRDALERQVIPVLPEVGRQVLEARITRLLLTGNDRLLQAELGPRLAAGSPWLELTDRPGPNTIVVDLQKLQWEEREPAEEVRTIRYAMPEVTALPPRHKGPPFSSYAYEQRRGEASVEYAVEVALLRDGRPVDGALLRDYLEAAWTRCDGARLENPYGGAEPVAFYANRHMEAVCATGARPVDVRSLRAPALDSLAAAILALQAIRGAM